MEIWKDIPDFEGKYQISNFGRVKSMLRYQVFSKGGKIEIPEKIRKPILNSEYLNITLSISKNNIRMKRIHILVATCFIPNPENKPQVNHKDGDKLNNHVDNLEWVTSSENLQHAYDTGLKFQHIGEKNPGARFTNTDVILIKSRLSCGEKYKNIAKSIGCNAETIRNIKTGKTWAHI